MIGNLFNYRDRVGILPGTRLRARCRGAIGAAVAAAVLWFASGAPGAITTANAAEDRPASPSGYGAATPPPDLTALPLEQLLQMEVYAASQFTQRRTEAPSAVSVVTREDIRTYGYRTLGEALSSVRGVFTTYDRNYRYLGIRGFARPGDYNSRVLLLIDGYSVNDNVYNQASIGHEFPLDLALVERIEFIPGPGSSLYGSNAFFGVINVITRSATDVGTELSGYRESYGGNGLRASAGRRLESGTELMISISRHASDGQNLFFPEFTAVNGGVAQGLDREQARKLYARAAHGPFTFSLGASGRTKGIPTAAYGMAFNTPVAETLDEYRFADLRYQSAIGERTELVARIRYNDYAYVGDYVYDVPPLVPSRDETNGTAWGVEARLLHRLSERHRLVAGLEHQRDTHLDQRYFDVAPFASYLDDRRRAHRSALYAQSEYQLRPDLILNAGARYDQHSDFAGNISPRLGLIYLPAPDQAVKLLYGHAFRAPNAYERFYEIAAPSQKGNPSLSPERIRTYELVYELTRSATRYAASVYHYNLDSLIEQVVDPADGRLVFQNAQGIRTNGVEAEAEHRFGSGVRLRGNLAWQLARTTTAWLDNSPKTVAKLFVSAPVGGDRLRLGAEALYLGTRMSARGEVPDYAVVNLNVTARIDRHIELQAGLYNAFDRRYYDPGGSEHVQPLLEQDGRNARVTLNVRF